MENSNSLKVQDTGGPEDGTPLYYTHGWRQYYGTCKYHRQLDCRHLVNWKPGKMAAGSVQLAKTVMREKIRDPEDIPARMRCKTCWNLGS